MNPQGRVAQEAAREAQLAEVAKYLGQFPSIPNPNTDDAWARKEPLTPEQMAKVAGVPIEMVQRWIRHGQLQPLAVAMAQPSQVPDLALAKQCAREGIPFEPKWVLIPAEVAFKDWWENKPAGRARLLSLQHRREMQNMDRGLPASYVGPGDPIKDELLADMKHAMEKGQSATDVALNKLNPQVHDERAAKREAVASAGARG